jgi:hypothetical protein
MSFQKDIKSLNYVKTSGYTKHLRLARVLLKSHCGRVRQYVDKNAVIINPPDAGSHRVVTVK